MDILVSLLNNRAKLLLLALVVIALVIPHIVKKPKTSEDKDAVDQLSSQTAHPGTRTPDARSAQKNRPATRKLSEAEIARQATDRFVREKLERIIIPIIQFDDTTVEEALDYLRLRARELDPEPDEARKGMGFMVRRSSIQADPNDRGADALDADAESQATPGINQLRLSMKAKNIPLRQALDMICEQANLKWSISGGRISIGHRE